MVTACGKTRYPTSHKAAAGLQSIRKRSTPADIKPTRYYLCEKCHGWHLTSQPN